MRAIIQADHLADLVIEHFDIRVWAQFEPKIVSDHLIRIFKQRIQVQDQCRV